MDAVPLDEIRIVGERLFTCPAREADRPKMTLLWTVRLIGV
jgi:hypothetical protein